MQCITHPTKSGLNTCCKCGSWLCEDCTVEVGGRMFCRRCLQEALGTTPAHEDTCCTSPISHSGSTPRRINWGLLFMFTIILPGLNYMYEGLIKRGLCALSGFFALVYLTSIFNAPLFGMLIVVLWVTCAFDGFHIRRRINSGEHVDDNINDVSGFIKRNKSAIIAFICVIVVFSILGAAGNFLSATAGYYRHAMPFRSGISIVSRAGSNLVPWIALGFGVYFLHKLMKKDSCKRHAHKHDHKSDDLN